MLRLLAIAVTGVSGLALAAGPDDKDAPKLPLLASFTFDDGKLERFKFSDPKAWEPTESDIGKALTLARKANYKPKFRSPERYAILDDIVVSDFTLDVRAQSTVKDYGHRDLCLFVGYQDPDHYYYVHVAKAADPHAHSIFLVNGAARVSIATERTKGFDWTDGWHKLRVERRVADGSIKVYVDDFAKPIMQAVDKTFVWGKIGVGSFDDLGKFDDLELRGTKVDLPKQAAKPADEIIKAADAVEQKAK